MEITWLGHSCFRLRGKNVTIVTDPYEDRIGYRLGRVSADIVTVSHNHYDHNNVSAVGGNPRVIKGPGEYEIGGIFITGVQTFHDAESGGKRGPNTAYLIDMDDLVTCHLGDLGHALTAQQVEDMSNVDILLVPVGGSVTITATQAAEVISLIEPRIVIPMHYRTEGLQLEIDPLERFARAMGLKEIKPLPKLSVTRSNLPEETQVMVLDYKTR
ncbi:MAG: MBL fold metallo-hydrolase [Chloroflexi bacterium]|nr:MBL fold metallo-hydrolase [Chloroflexota bacterium]MCL5109811.1 MBL fold metallo-hydrolase [Chloroflexota bacterium]